MFVSASLSYELHYCCGLPSCTRTLTHSSPVIAHPLDFFYSGLQLTAPPPQQAASPFDSFGQSAPQQPPPVKMTSNSPNFDPFGGLNSAASAHASGNNGSGSGSNFNPFDAPTPPSSNYLLPTQQSAPSPWDSNASANTSSSNSGFQSDFSNTFPNSNNGAPSALSPPAAAVVDPFASMAQSTQAQAPAYDPWAIASVDPWGETSKPATQPAPHVPHVPPAQADPFGSSTAAADPFSAAPSTQLPASWLDSSSSSSSAAAASPPPAPTTTASSDFDALFGTSAAPPPKPQVVVLATPVANSAPGVKREPPPDSGITNLVQSVDEMDIWGSNSGAASSQPPRESAAAADEDDGHDQLELQSGASGDTYEV